MGRSLGPAGQKVKSHWWAPGSETQLVSKFKIERLRKTPDVNLWPPCTYMYINTNTYTHTPHADIHITMKVIFKQPKTNGIC